MTVFGACDRRVVVVAVAAWFVAGGGGVRAEAYKPKVGAVHPQFVLPTIDGERVVSLSGLRGKKILLVHFASW